MTLNMDNGVRIEIMGDECQILLTDGKVIKIDKEGLLDFIWDGKEKSSGTFCYTAIREAVGEMRLN